MSKVVTVKMAALQLAWEAAQAAGLRSAWERLAQAAPSYHVSLQLLAVQANRQEISRALT